MPAAETVIIGAGVTGASTAFHLTKRRKGRVIVVERYTAGSGPTSKTIGTGKAYVFTNGVMYEGKWTRDDRLKPFELTDSAGAPIKLTPGQTFVEVARAAKTAVVAPGVDPETVKYP